MKNEEIERALDRVIHESPYNGPIVAQAYRDLVAGVKLFGVPARQYHEFLSDIESESGESGRVVLAKIAALEAQLCAVVEHKLTSPERRDPRDHVFGGECWCKPEVLGSVMMHR